MLLQGSYIADQNVLLVAIHRANFREFAYRSKYGHLARKY